jgi:hypothetical protein
MDWIERKKGSFIDEEELCARCKANGAVAELTGGGLRARLRMPHLRGRHRREANQGE